MKPILIVSLLTAALLSSTNPGVAMPVQLDPADGSGQPSVAEDGTPIQGSTTSGTGYATSTGVVYPDKTTGKPYKVDNSMKPGTADAKEKAECERLGIKIDPRSAIASIVNSVARKEWQIGGHGNLFPVIDSSLQKTFPNHVFYVLRFPQWPVGYDVPAPLANNNIFAVDKTSKPLLITTPEKLKTVFAQFAKVADQTAARTALTTWLQLSQELHQDGMFKFDDSPSGVTCNETQTTISVSGQVAVAPVGGNTGEIKATLRFDRASGAMTDFNEDVNLQEGMRPICQSTKLLDKDPLVRKMAEQDLLIMGKFAKPYLDWQRERVSPELQHAIDAVWQKILDENRYAEF
jgi:hypothetical protein